MKRFLRIWGPLLIKFLIVYVVSAIFSAFVMGQYFESTVGLDSLAISEFMTSEENISELYNYVWEKSVQYVTPMEGLAALITIPVMALLIRKDRKKERNSGVVPVKKVKYWKYGAVALMSAALCIGMNNLFFISNLTSLSAEYEETMEALYSTGFAMQILCLGILVPVCEELVFRGLMYKRMRENAGFVWAMIYTAIVFSFVHVNIVQAIYAFVMAVVFAFVYEKYGSLTAPVIAHVVANVVAVLATEYQMFEWVMADSMRAGMITVACAFVASSMYVFIQRMEDEQDNIVPEQTVM